MIEAMIQYLALEVVKIVQMRNSYTQENKTLLGSVILYYTKGIVFMQPSSKLFLVTE